MKTFRPFHFHSCSAPACNSWAVRIAKVRSASRRRLRALQELAVLGEQTLTPLAAWCAMTRATALRQLWSSLSTWTEEAPNGRDRIENAVPILDARVVEDVEDVGFSQNMRKGK